MVVPFVRANRIKNVAAGIPTIGRTDDLKIRAVVAKCRLGQANITIEVVQRRLNLDAAWKHSFGHGFDRQSLVERGSRGINRGRFPKLKTLNTRDPASLTSPA